MYFYFILIYNIIVKFYKNQNYFQDTYNDPEGSADDSSRICINVDDLGLVLHLRS